MMSHRMMPQSPFGRGFGRGRQPQVAGGSFEERWAKFQVEHPEIVKTLTEFSGDHRAAMLRWYDDANSHYQRAFESVLEEEQRKRQEVDSLCAVTLRPVNPNTRKPYGSDEAIDPYTDIPLWPVTSRVAEGPFLFVHGQELVAIVTHADDARAGWCFSRGGGRFSTDAMGPMAWSDVGFSIFHTVAGLLLAAKWQREIVEQVEFYLSATLHGPPAPMVHGVTLMFKDGRTAWDIGEARWCDYDGARSGLRLDISQLFQSVAVAQLVPKAEPTPPPDPTINVEPVNLDAETLEAVLSDASPKIVQRIASFCISKLLFGDAEQGAAALARLHDRGAFPFGKR